MALTTMDLKRAVLMRDKEIIRLWQEIERLQDALLDIEKMNRSQGSELVDATRLARETLDKSIAR